MPVRKNGRRTSPRKTVPMRSSGTTWHGNGSTIVEPESSRRRAAIQTGSCCMANESVVFFCLDLRPLPTRLNTRCPRRSQYQALKPHTAFRSSVHLAGAPGAMGALERGVAQLRLRTQQRPCQLARPLIPTFFFCSSIERSSSIDKSPKLSPGRRPE